MCKHALTLLSYKYYDGVNRSNIKAQNYRNSNRNVRNEVQNCYKATGFEDKCNSF